jgi:hypothetical protein
MPYICIIKLKDMTKKLQNQIIKMLPKFYRLKKYNTNRIIQSVDVNGDEVIITYVATSPIFYPTLNESQEQIYLSTGRDITLQGKIQWNVGEVFQINIGKITGVRELVRDYKLNKLV